jgi:hypothetical protein
MSAGTHLLGSDVRSDKGEVVSMLARLLGLGSTKREGEVRRSDAMD